MTKGKRAGTRRAARRTPKLQPAALLLALGVTLAVVAWGYLVYAAIDFGTSARNGDARGWWLLALASVGAVACLFVALMLVARLLRRLGITSEAGTTAPARRTVRSAEPDGTSAEEPSGATAVNGTPVPGGSSMPPLARPVGGRRAAR